MRKLKLGISAALLCCGAGIALAQVTSTMRPAPVMVSPRAMQAAAGTDVYQVQIDQLKAQTNSLNQQLIAARNELSALRKDLATTSSVDTQRLNANDKKISDLNSSYQSHKHYYQYTHIGVVNGQLGNVTENVMSTTIQSHNCVFAQSKKGDFSNINDYNCKIP